MKNLLITREVDYALRILRALSSTEQLSTGALCKQEVIPQQFAYKILRKLSKGGFVAITRGTEGGCRLITDLEEKSLFDLMAAMDSTELVNACMQPGFLCGWQQNCGRPCAMHQNLSKVQQAIDRELSSHSLASLLADAENTA